MPRLEGPAVLDAHVRQIDAVPKLVATPSAEVELAHALIERRNYVARVIPHALIFQRNGVRRGRRSKAAVLSLPKARRRYILAAVHERR